MSAGVAVIIEDDIKTRELIGLALQSIHLAPVGFGSGEAAIAWMQEHGCPALITCDLGLPQMSGFAVCAWLRSNAFTANVPVVVVTGRLDMQDEAAAIDYGADYLTKPFRVRDLVELASSRLESGEEYAGTLAESAL